MYFTILKKYKKTFTPFLKTKITNKSHEKKPFYLLA